MIFLSALAPGSSLVTTPGLHNWRRVSRSPSLLDGLRGQEPTASETTSSSSGLPKVNVVISLTTKQLYRTAVFPSLSYRNPPSRFRHASPSRSGQSPGNRLATCDRTQVTRPESCILELHCQSKHEGAASPTAALSARPELRVSGPGGCSVCHAS